MHSTLSPPNCEPIDPLIIICLTKKNIITPLDQNDVKFMHTSPPPMYRITPHRQTHTTIQTNRRDKHTHSRLQVDH